MRSGLERTVWQGGNCGVSGAGSDRPVPGAVGTAASHRGPAVAVGGGERGLRGERLAELSGSGRPGLGLQSCRGRLDKILVRPDDGGGLGHPRLDRVRGGRGLSSSKSAVVVFQPFADGS